LEPVENSENSELRGISCFPSHSGHRGVVHRSRSETRRARLTPVVCPLNNTAESALLGPGPRRPGLLFFSRVMAMTARLTPILAAVAITIGPSLAYGSPACMTESEAKAKFPKAHLYTHGSEHCWNDSAANALRVRSAVTVDSPRHPARTAVPAPSPRPSLASTPEIVNSNVDAGAQCRYSPCE
jgi:hypothetical protein